MVTVRVRHHHPPRLPSRAQWVPNCQHLLQQPLPSHYRRYLKPHGVRVERMWCSHAPCSWTQVERPHGSTVLLIWMMSMEMRKTTTRVLRLEAMPMNSNSHGGEGVFIEATEWLISILVYRGMSMLSVMDGVELPPALRDPVLLE